MVDNFWQQVYCTYVTVHSYLFFTLDYAFTTTVLRPPHCDPLYVFNELKGAHQYCALLESADRAHGTNDNSFIALGARDVVTTRGSDPLQPLEQIIKAAKVEAQSGLNMGYIGFLSYESARFFAATELKPAAALPDGEFFMPEVLIKIDHQQRQVTVVSHADTKLDLFEIEKVIMRSPFFDDEKDRLKHSLSQVPLLSLAEIEPYRHTSSQSYQAVVASIKDSIAAGEAFQVVLSQELQLKSKASALTTYRHLRAINPSPYMYYWQTPARCIVGASPETLIRVQGRELYYRPIAGTRKRTGDEELDAKMRQELFDDPKERCEHQMLVDLGRNDIGKVSAVGSIALTNLFHIERYAHLYHIVSDIRATLRSGLTSFDALRAVFPAGTLTGAPKLRAMEIIASQETAPRGIYGGAFGYVDLSGDLDFAITIRTMLFTAGVVSLRVGAGIVAGSVPEYEDKECLHKARSCLAAVTLAQS